MYRIRISLPKRQAALYRHLDLLHDALINAWVNAGAEAESVIGSQARPWTFAPLGNHQGETGRAHSLIVATADPLLTQHLQKFDPASICKKRNITAEEVDFRDAGITPEPDPIPPVEGTLGCFLLSPIALSERSEKHKRWHKSLNGLDLADPVNRRLSRMAERPINLQIYPDSLYLRANPKHSVLVSLKRMRDGRHAFVIGMQAPLLLAGSEDDLRFAWYAGIGEKTRNGFGCLGLIERGVGR